VINAAGKNAVVCGNIGNPFSGEVSRLSASDFVVLEVSSFQLEKIRTFKPLIALITNLNPNHLDRYKDLREYTDAKKRVFMNQGPEDYLVLNSLDPVVSGFAAEARSQAVYFGASADLNPNQSAVASAASILGIDNSVCMEVFRSFKGLEHRMEEVARIGDITFINDSKATTVESAIWALQNIPSRAVLIAGGKDKGLDYSLILGLAQKKLRSAVLIGQARRLIRNAFSGKVPVEDAVDMRDAVIRAYRRAQPGDCVILSPMCASYDMFADYEDRGRVFKSIVKELEREVQPRVKK
jgi:UDP-N-acetylmuramoylalanine--D-glutamate ligase